MSPKGYSLLDANIFLRYLIWDDEIKAERCKELFERLELGEEEARVLDITLAEVIWTLQKFFGIKKERIRDVLKTILGFKGLKLADKDSALLALDAFAKKNVDFPDAYLAEIAKKQKLKVYSYDTDIGALQAERAEP